MSRVPVRWSPVVVIASALFLGPACAGPAAAAGDADGVVRSAAPTSWAPYPPSPPSITVESSTTCAGCQNAVSVSGFDPGTTVDFTLHTAPVDLGSAVTDASGDATLRFRVPSDTAPGKHTIVASGCACGKPATASVAIMVTAGKTNWAAPGSLARTDANTGRPHGVAAALHPAGVGPAGETSRAEGFAPRSLAHTGTDVALPAGVAAAALGAGGALLLVNRRRRTAKTTKS